MQILDRSFKYSEKLSFFFALLFTVSIPISTALMNISVAFLLIFSLFSKDFYINLKEVVTSKVFISCLIIYSVMIIGYFWSIADSTEINRILLKYLKLVLIPLLTIRFFFVKNNLRTLENTIIGTSLFITILPHLIFLGLLNDQTEIDLYITQFEISQTGAFKTHIITNIFVAIASFFSTLRYLYRKEKKYFYISLILFNYIFILSDGMAGQIISALLIIFLFSKFKFKNIFFFATIGFIITTSLFTEIPSFGHNEKYTRKVTIDRIVNGIKEYHAEEINNSFEHRLSLWHNGILVFFEKPLFGYGTGSTNLAFNSNLDILMSSYDDMSKASNPHSELIFWLMQFGIFGITVVSSVFLFLLKIAINQPDEITRTNQIGVLLFLLVGSAGTSLIMDSGEGHLAIILLSAYFAK